MELNIEYIYLDEHMYRKDDGFHNVFCSNCGNRGHIIRSCTQPITSFGIIAFKEIENADEEKYDKNEKILQILDSIDTSHKLYSLSKYPILKFLMIQRKDTIGYIDFVRGKYPANDPQKKQYLLETFLNEMTFEEKHNILTKPFDDIWNALWINKNSTQFLQEYSNAKNKYQELDIPELIKKTSQHSYKFSEFSFPKGRRSTKEKNIECAEREFFEETGYDKSTYDFIPHYYPIQEEFIGTNNIKYKHVYYLVKMKKNIAPPKIDINNILQTGEVKNIGWFSYHEVLSIIRPYDIEKKKVIKKIYNDIIKIKNNCNYGHGDSSCDNWNVFKEHKILIQEENSKLKYFISFYQNSKNKLIDSNSFFNINL